MASKSPLPPPPNLYSWQLQCLKDTGRIVLGELWAAGIIGQGRLSCTLGLAGRGWGLASQPSAAGPALRGGGGPAWLRRADCGASPVMEGGVRAPPVTGGQGLRRKAGVHPLPTGGRVLAGWLFRQYRLLNAYGEIKTFVLNQFSFLN